MKIIMARSGLRIAGHLCLDEHFMRANYLLEIKYPAWVELKYFFEYFQNMLHKNFNRQVLFYFAIIGGAHVLLLIAIKHQIGLYIFEHRNNQ